MWTGLGVVGYGRGTPTQGDAVDEFELAEAVSAGAEIMDALDAKITDDAERWFWVVNPATLDMDNNGDGTGQVGCITAQHQPDGYARFAEYGVGIGAGEPTLALAFNLYVESAARTRRITALWREAITDRRAAWFDAHPEHVIA